MTYRSICISSGHGLYVRGASGIIDEVDQARRVTSALAAALRERGVEVETFNDDKSKNQNDNLNAIVDWHNSKNRELDISVHFNAFEQTSSPRGVEVLYVTQSALAGQLSAAMATAGHFINRGAKKRTDLFVLNNTEEPCVLLETCFVDSQADCDLYYAHFDAIIDALATVLGGDVDETGETPPPVEPVTPPATVPRIDIEVSGEVLIFINGEQIGTKG